MKYKAIFFDADGVLIKNKFLFTDQLKNDFGIEIDVMLPFFLGVYRQCSVGKADLKQELPKVIKEWGWKGSIDELLEYWFTKGTQIDQVIVDYVLSLKEKGIRCFMVTDQEKYRGKHLQKTLGGGKVFEDVFYSAEIGCSKKTEPFWDEVFSRVNSFSKETIKRDQTLFTDDDDHKVEAVEEFGINTHLFTDLDSLKKYLEPYV
jgi:putative hydrolase of the HAD superfamily